MVNAAWHKANQMPPKATLDQRIKWRLEHNKACACREIPPRLQAEITKRGLA
jgi:hypothetical protein